MKALIDILAKEHRLSKADYLLLLTHHQDEDLSSYLFEKARQTATHLFGHQIYTRGLIEFTNYCKQDCYYCGIRRSNTEAERYRLTLEDILSSTEIGYHLGFRTFVLQGGEDGHFQDDIICDILTAIKSQHPNCAITLSIGEKSRLSYERFFKAGADRYLLRHETANLAHYSQLHPASQSLEQRKQCLYDLKAIGYQVGTGFMVGSPYQTFDTLCEDLLFIQDFKPHMVGIGPFIPHQATPFKDHSAGTLSLTLFLIGLLRLILPNGLIPATTALGTIDPKGREKGILAGANVVMPNLSPVGVRKKYSLYNNKICTGEEAAECWACLNNRLKQIGYSLAVNRGDFSPL